MKINDTPFFKTPLHILPTPPFLKEKSVFHWGNMVEKCQKRGVQEKIHKGGLAI